MTLSCVVSDGRFASQRRFATRLANGGAPRGQDLARRAFDRRRTQGSQPGRVGNPGKRPRPRVSLGPSVACR